MYWECPECETEFETYSDADDHEHQVFTKDSSGDVFDIALAPTHPDVTASLSRRLKFKAKSVLQRALPTREKE